jgi:hypothetical protein
LKNSSGGKHGEQENMPTIIQSIGLKVIPKSPTNHQQNEAKPEEMRGIDGE